MGRISGKGSAQFLPVVRVRLKPRRLGFRAEQLLKFVKDYMRTHGRPPSYNTICDELQFGSKADVCKCVIRLEARGLMQRGSHSQGGQDWNVPVIRWVA